MDKPTKKYQVWQRDEQWFFNEFDTLEEAVASVKYGDYFITKLVGYKVEETEENA